MTLLVGIKCTDGVVIGSDSAVTFADAQGQWTISQSHSKKIDVLDEQIIVAGTGDVGLNQRFIELVTANWHNRANHPDEGIVEFVRRISSRAIENFASTGVSPIQGQGRYGALVAIPVGESGELTEFPTDLQPEIKTDENWYVSMGAGQAVADPLLGFVRSIFWQNGPPNRQEGIFAVTLVLELAFSMAPAGVSAPIQIATLQRENDKAFISRRLSEDELTEHRNVAESALTHFRHFKKQQLPEIQIPTPT